MKKVLVLMMALVLMLTFVACDGEASGGKEPANTSEYEGVMGQLLESGALSGTTSLSSGSFDDPTNSGLNGEEIANNILSTFNPYEIEIDEEQSGIEYYDSGCVKTIKTIGTVTSSGEPFYSIATYEDEQFSYNADAFVGSHTINLTGSFLYGGVAEVEYESENTIDYDKLTQVVSDAMGLNSISSSTNIEEMVSALQTQKAYLESDAGKAAIKAGLAEAMTTTFTFTKVVVDGVNYDPEAFSDYMTANYDNMAADSFISMAVELMDDLILQYTEL